jgi:hypothetical protein
MSQRWDGKAGGANRGPRCARFCHDLLAVSTGAMYPELRLGPNRGYGKTTGHGTGEMVTRFAARIVDEVDAQSSL